MVLYSEKVITKLSKKIPYTISLIMFPALQPFLSQMTKKEYDECIISLQKEKY